MTILQEEANNKGAFYKEENNIYVAKSFTLGWTLDKIIIDHIEVGESLKGKSAAKFR